MSELHSTHDDILTQGEEDFFASGTQGESLVWGESRTSGIYSLKPEDFVQLMEAAKSKGGSITESIVNPVITPSGSVKSSRRIMRNLLATIFGLATVIGGANTFLKGDVSKEPTKVLKDELNSKLSELEAFNQSHQRDADGRLPSINEEERKNLAILINDIAVRSNGEDMTSLYQMMEYLSLHRRLSILRELDHKDIYRYSYEQLAHKLDLLVLDANNDFGVSAAIHILDCVRNMNSAPQVGGGIQLKTDMTSPVIGIDTRNELLAISEMPVDDQKKMAPRILALYICGLPKFKALLDQNFGEQNLLVLAIAAKIAEKPDIYSAAIKKLHTCDPVIFRRQMNNSGIGGLASVRSLNDEIASEFDEVRRVDEVREREVAKRMFRR